MHCCFLVLICLLDSKEQINEFQDPAVLAKYSRDIEGELNKRFTLVILLQTPCPRISLT